MIKIHEQIKIQILVVLHRYLLDPRWSISYCFCFLSCSPPCISQMEIVVSSDCASSHGTRIVLPSAEIRNVQQKSPFDLDFIFFGFVYFLDIRSLSPRPLTCFVHQIMNFHWSLLRSFSPFSTEHYGNCNYCIFALIKSLLVTTWMMHSKYQLRDGFKLMEIPWSQW